MEIKFNDKDLKVEAIKNGLGLGLILVVLSLVSAYLVISSTSIWAIMIYPISLSIILPIVIAIFFSKDLRKKIGGYWNFRRATSGIFIMFLTCYIISAVVNLAYVKLVDPDMEAKVQTAAMDASVTMMKKQGLDQDKINEIVSEKNKEFKDKNSGTVMQKAQGYLIGIIFVFVLSLIFGAIFKKEPPLFVSDTNEN
ncbi:DUF4199 domain-containing protein [Pedobacter sp. KR3-3]|uniref:DUF4199 domain-containing protein n=1 Tax=Pedobacter albus TaxID=3113905 RepID=A0ABU7I616_9SPHI|nr:DUF4199 domain-containing protein [Pedobacter sp. KR3-3]MEE1944910.1 DUF4199 domain-containing protein [Pedobacter sp. KR3-3]